MKGYVTVHFIGVMIFALLYTDTVVDAAFVIFLSPMIIFLGVIVASLFSKEDEFVPPITKWK